MDLMQGDSRMLVTTRRALIFRLSDWPLAQSLAPAYGLSAEVMKAPFYFTNLDSSVELNLDGLKERPVSPDETERITVVIRQLGRSFLRDPLVRRQFYGGGPRSLGFAYFPGVSLDALRARMEREKVEVGRLTDLLAEREAKEKKLTVQSLSTSFTDDEGIIDRHRSIREASSLSSAELLTRTLKHPQTWRNGLSSAAYWILSRAEHSGEFAVGPVSATAKFLEDLFLGYARHPVLSRRFVKILRTGHYARLKLDLQTLAMLVNDAPEDAYARGYDRLTRTPGKHEILAHRLRLARALWRIAPKAHEGQVRSILEECVAYGWDSWFDMDQDLSWVLAEHPDLGLRWLPTIWTWTNSTGVEPDDAKLFEKLFEVADASLPKALDETQRALLVSAAKSARTSYVRGPLGRLLARYGLDLDTIAKLPTDVAEVDVSVDIAVDCGIIALLEAIQEDLVGEINAGRAVAFCTGGDGVFRVRLSGRGLSEAEAARTEEGTPFVLAVRGDLYVDSGTEQHPVIVPKGRFRVSVHAIDRSGAVELPDYVLVFEKAGPHAKPPRRAELPVLPPF